MPSHVNNQKLQPRFQRVSGRPLTCVAFTFAHDRSRAVAVCVYVYVYDIDLTFDEYPIHKEHLRRRRIVRRCRVSLCCEKVESIKNVAQTARASCDFFFRRNIATFSLIRTFLVRWRGQAYVFRTVIRELLMILTELYILSISNH